MSDLRNNQQAKTATRGSFFRSNPVMNRLSKVSDIATSDKTVAYSGVLFKTAFFLLFTVAGIILNRVLNNILFAGLEKSVHLDIKGFNVNVAPMQLYVVAGVAILGIVTQLIAAFGPGTIPVTGTIYSVTQGYFISFMVFTVLDGYEWIGMLALAITIAIVLVMAILYTTGAIRATKKFRTVMLTLFGTMILISIVTFLGSLIPFTRPFVASIMGNFWISLGITALSIIIASLFLISDFAMIQQVVENRMPKKYEWMAAFGLVFTVLWIYVKVLDILIQLIGNSKK